MKNKKYPIGGFAPGNYQCKCVSCKEFFIGDKRAVQCEDCATKEVVTEEKEYWKQLNEEIMDENLNEWTKKDREQQLLQMGFKKNKHQQCFSKHIYGQTCTVDFIKIEQAEDLWNSFLTHLKSRLKLGKSLYELKLIESIGYKFAQKNFRKELKDKLNTLKSKLAEEKTEKISKTINTEKIKELEIKIETIKELMK